MVSEPARRRTRLPVEERKRRIVEAAIGVIAAQGIHAFRLVDVGARAGVSQALVSTYFASRDELVGEAFSRSDEQALAAVLARVPSSVRGLARVSALCLACLDTDQVIAESWELWHQVWSLGRFSPDLEVRVRARQSAWAQSLADAIVEGQRDATIAASLDAERVAMMLVTLLDGLAPALHFGLLAADDGRTLLRDAVAGVLGAASAVAD